MLRAARRRGPSALTSRAWWLALGLGVVVLLLATVGALALGSPSISLDAVLNDPDGWQRRAFFALQLPRVAMGVATGATLALTGAALQGLLRNPLADPFILGVSGGAALGSTVAVLSGLTFALAAPIGGFAGALAALVVVTALATERGRISPLKMLLIGVIFNALAGAALMVLHTLADPAAAQLSIVRLMGSVSADPSRPELLPVVIVSLAIAAIPLLATSRSLNLLALGDETAQSLGVRPDRLRLLAFVAISVAIGAVVAVTGLIGFVGLIIPHAVRLVTGPDHRLLLPLSALLGGAFVALADAFVSWLAVPLSSELPVGVVTALVGGPVFLALLKARPARGYRS